MANARRTETQKVIEYEPEMPLTVYWSTCSFKLFQSPIVLVPTCNKILLIFSQIYYNFEII